MVGYAQELTLEMLVAGRNAVKQLEAKAFPLAAALWLLNAESHSWTFVIASDARERMGPRVAYQLVKKILTPKGSQSPLLPLQNVSLVPPDDPIIRAIRMVLKNPGNAEIRMAGNTINGVYIWDAHVYRVR